MGVKWTEEQEKVIRLRNRNILVSAAAGSGKTAVLVERIITMLTKDDPPMDVDRASDRYFYGGSSIGNERKNPAGNRKETDGISG